MIPPQVRDIAYVIAAVLFIFDLKWMAHPKTAVRGNIAGTLGMALAIAAHNEAVTQVAALEDKLHAAAELLRDTFRRGNKVLVCGNGGSAADAQHFAAEFVVRFVRNRRALPSIAFTTDTSILTACANDFGYDDVFARALAKDPAERYQTADDMRDDLERYLAGLTPIATEETEATARLAAAAAAEGTAFEVPDMEWDKRIKLGFEKEMLGLYVSDHPLMGLEPLLATMTDRPLAGLADEDALSRFLPPNVVAAVKAKVAIEAGSPQGWHRYVGAAGRVIGARFAGSIGAQGDQ